METKEYFELFSKKFNEANRIATAAHEKGFDPEQFVEIKAAPDLASRVEGIMNIGGLAEIIKKKAGKSRQDIAFEIVKEICTDKRFEMETSKRITLAVRVGLCVLTEGILVAPTEGLQGVEIHKNSDGSDYVAVLYAGPIRGAGGTSAALSVALADSARKIFGIGNYRATQTEVQRWIEEMLIYHSRKARLQYLPSEDDMRVILENCPVCVDGVPTEDMEVGIHRNMKRLDASGKEEPITNKVRGGIGLVVCEGIAQKAKSMIKYTKNAGLDWSWLNNIIRVEKRAVQLSSEEKKDEAVFLQELVAGRPVLAYPNYPGSFRLRYGRSRMTGIAAKGFSPATMHILEDFIATGTQVKIEKPGKGCIATPVDSIEGPFIKTKGGQAMRVNSAEQARAISGEIAKIISVGDILVTYGDFKKTNTPLAPTSYVEEYWLEQLLAAGFSGYIDAAPSFKRAYEISMSYVIPMHPRWIYDYSEITGGAMLEVARAVLKSRVTKSGDSIFDVTEIEIPIPNNSLRDPIERMCIPHSDNGSTITVSGDDAQSLLASLGFTRAGSLFLDHSVLEKYDPSKDSLEMLSEIAPFRIMRRATRVGARIGRPEKARERLMTPAPHILFPIGEYGSKDRNLYKAYMEEKRRLGTGSVEIEIARYRCAAGKEYVISPYCGMHKSRAVLERVCEKCGRITQQQICQVCGGRARAYGNTKVSLSSAIDDAMKNVGVQSLPKSIKGVKGLVSMDKIAEPIEKGILRGVYGINIFKDGTTRFDATDAPMTHFYPKEVGVSVEKLRALGYTKDYAGNALENEDQLVELMHQDLVVNRRCAEYMLKTARFIDDLLVKFYKLEPYYNINNVDELVGHFVITLSPHTSCGVLGRIIGFTSSNVGFAHPYTICARRRNCDGDEDTTMLLLDGLINFSKRYLPVNIGGTMDAPLILSVNIVPEEVDDEVHAMEAVTKYGLDFYEKTLNPQAGEVSVELVGNRLNSTRAYSGIGFTHGTSAAALQSAPNKSVYTKLKTMQEKIDLQFTLMDKLYTIDKQDTARRLIISHFIPDLMGNLHSYSKQTFRCVACNAKYRRVPLVGKCTRCEGRIVLTISKGGIEKYLDVATNLADRYTLEPYIKQRIMLLKDEIETVFGMVGGGEKPVGQFDLSNYM